LLVEIRIAIQGIVLNYFFKNAVKNTYRAAQRTK
jgi:hypothetical protein